MNKDSFIKVLSSEQPEEINKYIEEKGKKKKLISAICFYNSKDDPLYRSYNK